MKQKIALVFGVDEQELELVPRLFIDDEDETQAFSLYEIAGLWQDATFFDEEATIHFENLKGEEFAPYEIIAFFAKNQLDIFKPAYASKEELVQEFKTAFGEKIETLFGADFDYEAHIGYCNAFYK